jgi:hypothetical protein
MGVLSKNLQRNPLIWFILDSVSQPEDIFESKNISKK